MDKLLLMVKTLNMRVLWQINNLLKEKSKSNILIICNINIKEKCTEDNFKETENIKIIIYHMMENLNKGEFKEKEHTKLYKIVTIIKIVAFSIVVIWIKKEYLMGLVKWFTIMEIFMKGDGNKEWKKEWELIDIKLESYMKESLQEINLKEMENINGKMVSFIWENSLMGAFWIKILTWIII